MMGVSSCMSMRQVRTGCHCPACPRASGHGLQVPPQTLVLPPMALEPETTPVKDKKGSKMKVLKKIKRKIGLAPRTSCTGGAPNNLPPLSFHAVHGENVRVSRDGSTARRVESFCKGVAFSARPVRVNEKVCIRFVEISNSWSGVIRFGFTTNDPTGLAHALPKYACPDLTNKPGNWAKALGERFCEKDNVLHYSVNSAGDVHFGVNGEDKGLFFSGVDTRSPLWALVDVYGNCTAVAFADPRAPRRDPDALLRGLRALSVADPPPRADLPAPRHALPLAPLPLHRTRGRNVCEANERGEAARADAEFCQGYVFSARPLRPGQTVVVQILATDESACAFAGSLAVGLTSCDPAALRPGELPDDAEQLLDRPEYWVVKRDAADGLRRGDELAVTLTPDGEVRVSRNGAAPAPAMHVDHSLRLWAFVDIYGATTRVRLWRSQAPSPPPLRLCAPGAVLVVSLPPSHYDTRAAPAGPPPAHYEPRAAPTGPPPSHYEARAAPACPPPAPYEPRAAPAGPPAPYSAPAGPPAPYSARAAGRSAEACASSSQNSCNEQLAPGERRAGAECTICYEQPVDSVLYMCGHMCMCYRCAVQQWRGKGGGQCPLCRAQIKDVIRTYKS